VEQLEYIKDFQEFFYEDFIKHAKFVVLEKQPSKKQLKKVKNEMRDESFYPIYFVNLDEDATKKELSIKQIEESKSLFSKRYHELIRKQFHLDDKSDICTIVQANIKACPYCKANEIIMVDTLEEYRTKHHKDPISGFFFNKIVCNSCKETITSKMTLFVDFII